MSGNITSQLLLNNKYFYTGTNKNIIGKIPGLQFSPTNPISFFPSSIVNNNFFEMKGEYIDQYSEIVMNYSRNNFFT